MSKHPVEPASQHDPGAHAYMREAIELMRRVRGPLFSDARVTPLRFLKGRYDEMTLVTRNLRSAYEWLFPRLWAKDNEFRCVDGHLYHLGESVWWMGSRDMGRTEARIDGRIVGFGYGIPIYDADGVELVPRVEAVDVEGEILRRDHRYDGMERKPNLVRFDDLRRGP